MSQNPNELTSIRNCMYDIDRDSKFKKELYKRIINGNNFNNNIDNLISDYISQYTNKKTKIYNHNQRALSSIYENINYFWCRYEQEDTFIADFKFSKQNNFFSITPIQIAIGKRIDNSEFETIITCDVELYTDFDAIIDIENMIRALSEKSPSTIKYLKKMKLSKYAMKNNLHI